MIMCSRLGAQWGLQPEFTGRLGANGLHPQHAAGKCINSSCSVLWQAFGGYRRLDLCQSIARPKWWPAWAAGSPSQPGEDGSAPLAPHQRRQVCLCACANVCLLCLCDCVGNGHRDLGSIVTAGFYVNFISYDVMNL